MFKLSDNGLCESIIEEGVEERADERNDDGGGDDGAREDGVDVIDEDISITFVSTERFPLPMKSTVNEMIKRENDIISGNLPFNELVRAVFLFLFHYVFINIIYITEKGSSSIQHWRKPNQNSCQSS